MTNIASCTFLSIAALCAGVMTVHGSHFLLVGLSSCSFAHAWHSRPTRLASHCFSMLPPTQPFA